MTKITKIRYTCSHYKIDVHAYSREVYVIYPDGTIDYKDYAPGERKCRFKERFLYPQEAFEPLCQALRSCIDSATHVEMFEDDSDAELTLYHTPDRTETMNRGLGDGEVYIADIMSDFLARY